MNPFALSGLLGGAGSALGGLAGLFGLGGRKNPAKEANQYLNQIPGAMQPYYQPYQQAGNQALGTLQGEYGKMLNNPGELLNNLSAGYKESPGYQRQLQQALKAAQNSQAAGGMLGSLQDQDLSMQTASDIASKDYQQYLDRVLGLYGGGISGTQGLETQGYGANTDYANMLGTLYGTQGQNAYNAAQGQNMARGQDWANLFGGLGQMGKGYLSGNALDQYFNNLWR